MPQRSALPLQGVSKGREISGAVFMKPAFCELATNACTDARGISLVKIMRFHACAISSAEMSLRVSASSSAFTLFIENLHARDEYRRRGVGLLDQHLAAGFVFKP